MHPPAPRQRHFSEDDDRTRVVPLQLPRTGGTRVVPPLRPVALPTPAADRRVGRYHVGERLGGGGMASVYQAHDPSLHRDVAIKFLHPSLAEDEECRARFLREARAAGGLSHPNIVVVHDVGEIDGRPYIAMELVQGSTLADALEAQMPVAVRDAVVIAIQLARALEYAHAHGIVHRDIKPANVMLLADRRTVKVADFGIAHVEDGQAQRTQLGAVLGTPQYMSPEQVRGDRLDGRSDLFSAGIVLYQMLAGERPFRGDSLVALAASIEQAEPPPLADKRPEVPPSLRRVVARCLAKDPARRYQSGREMADALKKVLVEIDERQRQREQGRHRWVPLRVKWALGAGAVVTALLALSSSLITQRLHEAMLEQVAEQGGSLARFIARQNALAVLGDDWDMVDVALQEVMKTRSFDRVLVTDAAGTVRASTEAALLGRPWRREGVAVAVAPGLVAHRYSRAGENQLGFEAPVTFRDQTLGRVVLGVPEKPLGRVVGLAATLMALLAASTVLAVALAAFVVAGWFARPIRLVAESMDEIAKGRFDHRIAEPRRDELGDLFQAFDQMAVALQRREQGLSSFGNATLPPTPAPRG